jgi:hypothetical protein
LNNLSLKILIINSVFLFFTGGAFAATNTFDWKGTTSTDWTNTANWRENNSNTPATSYPGAAGSTTDIVNIGVSTSVPIITTFPVLATNITIASLTFGNNNAPSNTVGGQLKLTVNSNLIVSTSILQMHSSTGGPLNSGGTGNVESDSNFADFTFDVTTYLLGSGTINCATLQVGDNTVGANKSTVNATLFIISSTSATSQLTVTAGNVIINSASANNGTIVTKSSRALISLQDGTLTVTGTLSLTNFNPFYSILDQYESLSLFSMDLYNNSFSPVLNLAGATPLSIGTSPFAANPIDFYNVNAVGTGTCTVNYTGTNQRIFTYNPSLTIDAWIDVDPTAYQNLTLSGSGTKTVDAGALSVAGNLTLSGTNTIVDLSTNNPTLTVGGNYSSAAGTTFKNGSNPLIITGTTTNAGTFNHPGAGLVTMMGAITNSGSINQTGSGNINFIGAFSNSTPGSVLAQTGAGTLAFSAGCTNTGTISQGSGTIGAVSITGTLTNSGTLTQTTGVYTLTGGLINSGNLNLGTANFGLTGNFTCSGNFSQSTTGTIIFNGTSAETLTGIGTKFSNVTFSGNSTKTISSGSFSLASTGVLTMIGSTTKLATGGFLTLNSDANNSASVSAVPSGCSIAGNVNVQRYMSASRGYRLMSSPVYNGADTYGNNVYSINYLLNSVWLTGTTGIPGLFNKAGNPTLYLFREDKPISNASFISGNYRGVNNLSLSPSYTIDTDGPGFYIPAGNGYLMYYRGSKKQATLAAATTAGAVATTDTLIATGTLNQGAIIFKDWYNAGAATLGRTNSNTAVRGYNLAGNPYASTIDWETYGTSASSGISVAHLINTVYELNPLTKNYDAYQVGGQHTNNGTRYIVSGQGFFVLADTTALAPTLTFNEAAKVTNQNRGTLLFMGNPTNLVTNKQYLRLELAADSINKDNIQITFNSNSKTTFDLREDAPYKTGQGSVSLSSLSSDNVALAINQRPLTPGQMIPLSLAAVANGTYTLTMNELQGIPQLFDVWLIDNYKKDSVNMRQTNTYSFNITLSDTSSFGKKRFALVMRENLAFAYQLLSFTAARVDKKPQIEAVWKTANEQNYTHFTVERSSNNGKTFELLGSITSAGLGTYSFIDKDPLNGENLYRLKQEDYNNTITYSKTVQVQYSDLSNNPGKSNVSVYPNPVISHISVSITADGNTGASYNIQITNGFGLLIRQSTSAQPIWQANVADLLPGTYMVRVINSKNKSIIGDTKFVKL